MNNKFLTFAFGVISIISFCGVSEAQMSDFGRRGSQYSPIGVEACEKMDSFYQQDCLVSIRGLSFDRNLTGFCARKVDPFYIKECLAASANKKYEIVEIRACEREDEFYRVSCLKRFGTYSNRLNTNEDVLAEALDQVLTDLISDYFSSSTRQAYDICDIENSSGKILGQVSREDFRNTAQRYAQRQNSCVVTNIKNESRTRELIRPSGRIAGTEMTEQELNRAKRENNYDRCRVLTCAPRSNNNARTNNNPRRMGGGAIHESWSQWGIR